MLVRLQGIGQIIQFQGLGCTCSHLFNTPAIQKMALKHLVLLVQVELISLGAREVGIQAIVKPLNNCSKYLVLKNMKFRDEFRGSVKTLYD